MAAIWKKRVWQFINKPFRFHLGMGLLIRLLLICYAHFHDRYAQVQYTDVDYKVFSDAARLVVLGQSPYKRHTYRYSPIIAFLLTPNSVTHPYFGKILFSIFDIMIAIACKHIVTKQLHGRISRASSYCGQLWLYNPMSIAISTRGNADSMPCFFIIMSLYFLRAHRIKKLLVRYSLAGVTLGFAIHLRMYPIVFSFPMFLSLGSYDSITHATSILDGLWLLLPNRRQVTLALSCIATVVVLTFSMYRLYGYEFLFETYLYHLIRKDTRHNFSVLFYYSYLTMDEMQVDVVKVVIQVFEVLILIFLSLKFGVKQDSLPFAMFCQAVVLVAYNSVMTSQYFIWFLSLLPLVAHNFRIRAMNAFYLALAWIACQAAWLYYAYQLEFKSQQVFFYIWIKSVFFFCAHIYILTELIKCYRLSYGFGLIEYSRMRKSQ